MHGIWDTDPGPGVADSPRLPPLFEAYGAQRHPGRGFVIECLSPCIGTDVMHLGPILVSLEAAAIEAARSHAGSDSPRVQTAGNRLVRAARRGPFVSTAEVIAVTGDTLVCRAEVRDEGADNCVVAVALMRIRNQASQ